MNLVKLKENLKEDLRWAEQMPVEPLVKDLQVTIDIIDLLDKMSCDNLTDQ